MTGLMTMFASREELSTAAESLNRMKSQAFSLLRYLVSGFPEAQAVAMNNFKHLIGVWGDYAFNFDV